MTFNSQNLQEKFSRYGLRLCIAALWAAIGVYAYLGSFSRFIADDYCEAARVRNVSPIRAAMDRYNDGAWRAANRYSNIMFVGFSEMLGERSIPITIVLMIALWFAGVIWSAREARRLAGMDWTLSMDLFLGSALVYFSLLMMPSLFQTLYWRSSMMTHFAPLALGSFWLAFLLRQARRSRIAPTAPAILALSAFLTFVLAGFSEPPTTTLLTILLLALPAMWTWDRSPGKIHRLRLAASVFIGALTGFLTMVFSPAISNVASDKSPDLARVFLYSFKYAFVFIVDSLRVVPLPLLVVFLSPLLLIWYWKQGLDKNAPNPDARSTLLWMIAPPLLAWLLIAAGFAPSVFGQSYPVERMRFLARLLIVLTLMLMGLRLGMFLPAFKPNPALGLRLSMLALVALSALYPLRAAYNLIQSNLPPYRQRAELWDLRHEYILRKAREGATNMIVPALSGFNGVKEVDGDPAHWINACAAEYYGLASIEAVSVETDEEYMEVLRGD